MASASAPQKVTRLAALMGGELSIEGGPGPPCRFVVTLPLAVEPRAPEADLDLRGQEVLIVSGDEVFAGEVIGLLDRWHADARCVGDVDTAGVASGVRPVVIVDGRDSPLTALAFAENLEAGGRRPLNPVCRRKQPHRTAHGGG